jgi:hypothetical protein
VTEPEPAPVFRRFPWIQLVFCIACLSMAGWAWMRFSHAWDASFAELVGSTEMVERYVHIEGTVVDRLNGCFRPRTYPKILLLSGGRDPDRPGTPWPRRHAYVRVLEGTRTPSGMLISIQGRAFPLVNYAVVDGPLVLVVDATVSRWHGGTIAGFVVGAMGCFIFGLYLRGWLRERRALAREPGQDTIAWA